MLILIALMMGVYIVHYHIGYVYVYARLCVHMRAVAWSCLAPIPWCVVLILIRSATGCPGTPGGSKFLDRRREWVNWRLRGCFPLDFRPLCWAASRTIRDL